MCFSAAKGSENTIYTIVVIRWWNELPSDNWRKKKYNVIIAKHVKSRTILRCGTRCGVRACVRAWKYARVASERGSDDDYSLDGRMSRRRAILIIAPRLAQIRLAIGTAISSPRSRWASRRAAAPPDAHRSCCRRKILHSRDARSRTENN